MRKSPRQRRLEADFRSVQQLDDESSIFSFLASGDPPNRYRLLFDGPGICKDATGKIRVVDKHEVIVELGSAYPRLVPNLLWQTPIFHPNISNNGVVCLGGYGTHWVPSLTLDEMSTMLWDMIRYKNFDIQSPYNRDAALWARDQRKYSFPLDERSIRDLVNNPEPSGHPFRSSAVLSEEKKPQNGKSVFGVIGALANRFRSSSDQGRGEGTDQDIRTVHVNENAATESHAVAVEAIVEEVQVIEGAESESSLVDPNEVEVIEDGIAFLDSSDKNEVVATNDVEDAGIVFLD